jgi:hypothetical protein
MDQKLREQAILRLVYKGDEYAEILESECPDFLIRHKTQNIFFGVEITEFYFSESNARLRNLPNYFSEIIYGNYRHKADRQILKASDLTITTADGEPKGNTQGILQELPKPEHYINMIATLIASKSGKFNEYNQTLSHINLIILDMEARLQSSPIETFYSHLHIPSLKAALYLSQFREIFILTRANENRDVCIPLKMATLLADLYEFAEIINMFPWETSSIYFNDVEEQNEAPVDTMIVFAKYLRAKTNNVRFRKDVGDIEVFFGNSSILVKDGHVTVHDYADYLLPPDLQIVEDNELTDFFSSTEFHEKAKDILRDRIFQTKLAYEWKGSLDF